MTDPKYLIYLLMGIIAIAVICVAVLFVGDAGIMGTTPQITVMQPMHRIGPCNNITFYDMLFNHPINFTRMQELQQPSVIEMIGTNITFNDTPNVFPNGTAVMLFTMESFVAIEDINENVSGCLWYTFDNGTAWNVNYGTPYEYSYCEQRYMKYGYYPDGTKIDTKSISVHTETLCGMF
jgi:hypothetical protein